MKNLIAGIIIGAFLVFGSISAGYLFSQNTNTTGPFKSNYVEEGPAVITVSCPGGNGGGGGNCTG